MSQPSPDPFVLRVCGCLTEYKREGSRYHDGVHSVTLTLVGEPLDLVHLGKIPWGGKVEVLVTPVEPSNLELALSATVRRRDERIARLLDEVSALRADTRKVDADDDDECREWGWAD